MIKDSFYILFSTYVKGLNFEVFRNFLDGQYDYLATSLGREFSRKSLFFPCPTISYEFTHCAKHKFREFLIESFRNETPSKRP